MKLDLPFVFKSYITKNALAYAKKHITLLKQNNNVILIAIVGVIFIDSIFIKLSSDFVLFGVLVGYWFYVKLTHNSSKLTFLLCLSLLTSMFVSYLFTQTSVSTEKFAVWLFLLLIFGIFQAWRE